MKRLFLAAIMMVCVDLLAVTNRVMITQGTGALQSAIDAARDGDVLLVEPGTYSHIKTDGKKITILSLEGADDTIIDGKHQFRCASLADEYSDDEDDGLTLEGSTLVGFTLKNGYNRCVEGVTDPCTDGGGVFGGTAINCIIKDSESYLICDGEDDGCGGGACRAVLYNCLVTGNEACMGAGASDCMLYNCTVVANESGATPIAYSEVYNSIVSGGGMLDTWGTDYHNCMAPLGEYSATGLARGDVKFVDAASGDYRLLENSAAIGKGSNSYVKELTTRYGDLDGNIRDRDTVDIGAYEYGSVPLKYANIPDLIWPDTVEWTYTVVNGEASLGSGDGSAPAVPSSTSGFLVIPEKIDGYPVTKIGDWAFAGCDSITGFAIPDGITSIGERQFEGCDAIEAFYVESDNPSFCVTNGLLCSKDGSVVIACPKNVLNVTLPDTVTSIREWAFSGCSSLLSLKIPAKVLYVGMDAFNGCSSLMSFAVDSDNQTFKSVNNMLLTKDGKTLVVGVNGSIEIPIGVTEIASSAFCCYDSLMSVSIPEGVTSIGDYVFEDCSSLMSVSLPSTLRSIGEMAFGYCDSLIEVVIPENVLNIGDYAFWGCSSLIKVQFNGDSPAIGMQVFDFVDESCTAYVQRNSIGWGVDIPGTWNGIKIEYSKDIPLEEVLEGKWTSGNTGTGAAKGQVDETATDGKSVMFTAEDSSSAWVETVVTNACRVTFSWKSSCEPLVKGSPYDYLSLEIDGVQKGFICDETDWCDVSVEVFGDGVHVLRWMFKRDDEGSSGENCAWLADVNIMAGHTLQFAAGGATVGTVPDSITFYDGDEVMIPDGASLCWPKHTFLGWSDGATLYLSGETYSFHSNAVLTAQWRRNVLPAPVINGPDIFESDSCSVSISAEDGASIRYTLDGTDPTSESAVYTKPITIYETTIIKTIAIRDDHFDSQVAQLVVTRGIWTFGEYLNCPNQLFSSGGDADWIRVKGVSDDGYALRSGAITHSQTSRIETVVSGPGTITFKCKVEGEILKGIVWDGLAFCVDGIQQGDLTGDATWVEKTYAVTGTGSHTLSWAYVKDSEGDGNGADCSWLDEVVWTPAPDPIPELPSTATADEVAAALGGFADAKLVANITDAGEYAAYREWALCVKTADGSAVAGAEAVKNAAYSWLSYALDTEKLIATAPVEGDVTIDTFENAATDGAFNFTVNVKDIVVGDGALEANIKKVFDIEGVEDLVTELFSADAVEVNAAAAEGGKVKFTVTPKGGESGALGTSRPTKFFFKVKMK